jgi:hypothetical protein
METRIGFLDRLEEDLQAAAARERLTAWEAERRDPSPVPEPGGGAGIAHARRRRGRGRPRRWLVASAAALTLLVVAGSVGFLATGGLPLRIREDAFGDGAVPASGAAEGATAGDDDAGNGGATRDRTIVAEEEALGYLNDADESFSVGAAAQSSRPADAPTTVNVGAAPRQLRDLSKIVRTGRIGVVVDNGRFEPTADRIRVIAEANEGFVQESSTRTRIGNFVVRVPSRRFDATITALGALGTVEFQSQRSDDVTAEFVDNKARLEILLERREVLRGFLREADTTAETLRFFNAVQEVQLDIERLQGQLAFLNDQVSFSTINVRLRERDAKVQTEPVDNPSIAHAFDRAIAGFLAVIGAVVIGLGYLLPVLVIAAIGSVVWWSIRRRRRS